jgi:hypothetical protein
VATDIRAGVGSHIHIIRYHSRRVNQLIDSKNPYSSGGAPACYRFLSHHAVRVFCRCIPAWIFLRHWRSLKVHAIITTIFLSLGQLAPSSAPAHNIPWQSLALQDLQAHARFMYAPERSIDTYRGARNLDPDQLHDLLAAVGFEGESLRIAWAIAMRESNGRPRAFNGNKATGDHSFGIFQINMIGQLGVDRRAKFGLSSNEELFDPVKNAEITFKMTAGGKNWGSWNLGPNAYKGGNSPAYERWYREYPY